MLCIRSCHRGQRFSLSGPSHMFELRPYQQEAVRRTVEHFRKSDEAAVIVLPTGSGKSLVIAELARIARGRVLVLAHVRELVEQNHAKYESYGIEADIFSAGLKRKQASRQVVFGSVQSVVRNLDVFSPADQETDSRAAPFTLLVIDECHRVSLEKDASYRKVINHLREHNPRLKVLGLTATPYRLGQGFIFHRHYHGMVRGDDDCFFRDCVFEQPLRLMVRQGFLSEPRRIDVAVARYDFSQLVPGIGGSFQEAELNEVVQGSRATPGIVLDIVAQARARRGVMVFCSTVEHAEEVTGLLPNGEAALITGETPGDERERLINLFKAQQLKYLVNVSVLTTGFDAPHVDLIAILRPTESVSLYQQIVGRGLRLSPDKTDCLILDYAGNPWDLYAPEVATPKPAGDTEIVQVECPVCGNANLFWGRKDGELVVEHFGRRCQGLVESPDGEGKPLVQCDFRYRAKACPQCGEANDIAARHCHACQARLVDPDDKLRDALKLRDARVLRVSGWQLEETRNGRGLPRLKVTYYDEDGTDLSEWFALETSAQRHAFRLSFLARHLRAPGSDWAPKDIAEVLAGEERLKAPDFVIGRKSGRYWQIRDKLFDYAGRYRIGIAAG